MSHPISRRSFLTGAAATAGALSCSSEPDQSASVPNIVLCMGDDHGWHETGYNGHPHVRTPVLDDMASTGLRLDRFYAAAPVCSPTRASVMTGRHPNRIGTFSANWSIRPQEITIAQILKDAGYACGHFGKWHLGPVKADSPTSPGAMGFEEWLSHDNFFEMDPYLSHNGGPPEKHEGESSKIIVDAARHFISTARAAGRPFFVVIWFGSPHEPYSGLDRDLGLYDDLPASLREQSAREDRQIRQAGEPHLPLRVVDRDDERVVLEQHRMPGAGPRAQIAVQRRLGDVAGSGVEEVPERRDIGDGPLPARSSRSEILREHGHPLPPPGQH